ncbi:methyltransferase domain-containing protein [Actinokineospora sp. 24-640]
MSVPTHSTVADLVDAFAGSGPEQLDERFRRLVAALWDRGALTEAALPAVPLLVSTLDIVDDRRAGYLAVLLGVLAEAEFPATDGPVATAVREGLDRYLELLAASRDGDPLTLALVYLLAHFPGDRERVLPVADGLGLHDDDITRMRRILTPPDRTAPDLGRVWPSPSVWSLDESEKAFDQSWIGALTDEQFLRNWENDTRTIMGHAGAKAYWAVCNGVPAPIVTPPVPPVESLRSDGADTAALFARHAALLRCPACHGGLELTDDGARCPACATAHTAANGILNLMPGAAAPATEAKDDTAALLEKLAAMPSMGLYYETVLRPAFLRAMGSNWGGQVAPTDEDDYIAEHVFPVDGPVLDLAAGAGRWTSVLDKVVGSERLIALDVSLPMLAVLRSALPDVPALQASAMDLPFADGTLGAVLCWNALQAMPDARAAIAEVGRCLRPGGTFTLLTFRWGDDALYSHFQKSHRFPNSEDGMDMFDPADIEAWLAEAGLTVKHRWSPGTFVFLTAERA